MSKHLEKAEFVPSNVPPDRCFDFDLFNIDGLEGGCSEDVHVAWKRVQDTHPAVFWTPRYGGHWVLTRYPEIARMQSEHENFSNREFLIPRGVVPLQIPEQLDPPEHTAFRKLLMPAFLPKALTRVSDKARQVAIELIEKLEPHGECEFVHDFAGAMPIIAFLTMLNLPETDCAYLRGLAVYMSKPNHERSAGAWEEISAYVRNWIELRRREPADDLISSLIHARIEGRALTDEEVFSMCLLVLGGGLDTVVSMTSFIACHLAQHPELRRELIEHPERIDVAVEECARRFGTSNLARIMRRDTELDGLTLREGDMVVGIFPLAGLDENVNPDPMTLDFTREQPKHLAFGTGPHTCIGAVLARREIRIFLQEWLPRIPDFRIKPGTRPHVTTGVVNSMSELHLEWGAARR